MGGAKLGVFTRLYCATEQYMAFQRSTCDFINVAAAGGLTVATIGLMTPGSITWRLPSALLGSVIGVTFGIPLGLLQSTVDTFGAKDKPDAKYDQQESVPHHDAVGDAIQRLEERVLSQK
ncbi:hypothetical protein L7F22_002761 [Adiantum nelumboides]|nr:hypothetical protein [Adiantum nelumboides]